MSDVRRVLITGGCGFIGANLVRLLRGRTDWSLRVVDDMRTGRPEMVEGLADVVEGDVGHPAILDRVLEGCRTKGVGRFVFASSGAAVGDVTPPIHENIVARPLSPYGAGKLVGEA